MKSAARILWSILTAVAVVGAAVPAEQAAAPQANAQAQTPAQAPAFKPEELEQIVAPIALYPDSLLAQIFMASTYPLEIVQAARWQKEHPDVKGDAVAKAVEKETWDASVKSLVAFPDVLTMMNEKLDWTQKLGDAFLAQQKEVMEAVQRLRVKAKEAGNLKSSKEQAVKTEPAPAGAAQPQIIIIESKDPEVIYVPTYNPTVVYGAWPYPAYPPYYYYPPYYPPYVPGAAFFSFSVGVVVGGAIWGNCNWGGNDIDIDINRQNNFNGGNRNQINNGGNRNQINNGGNRNQINNGGANQGKWNHDSNHRQGVGYRDQATQQKYNRGSSAQSLQSREDYRGRADQGREQMSREGLSQRDLNSGTRDLGGASAGTRDSSGYRDLGGTSNTRDSAGQRDLGSSSRDMGSSSRSSDAFKNVDRGSSTREYSSRGSSSRGASRGGGGRRR
ncbi:MAG TPA: DUF3300 domain-containing protein [Steroidobacteraceae bacterium]|jgi:hypothetical protein|nr:DUF3300 domain-containing protein [Steroidobacteraceae bacterium]